METKLKQKLPTTSLFKVIEKTVGNCHKAVLRLFKEGSSIATSFEPNEITTGGDRLFRYVKVNYDYLRHYQPKLY